MRDLIAFRCRSVAKSLIVSPCTRRMRWRRCFADAAFSNDYLRASGLNGSEQMLQSLDAVRVSKT